MSSLANSVGFHKHILDLAKQIEGIRGKGFERMVFFLARCLNKRSSWTVSGATSGLMTARSTVRTTLFKRGANEDSARRRN